MEDRGDLLVGLLIGGLVGILVGLMVAPAPGGETRRRLGERATDAGGRVREGATAVAGRVREGAGTVAGRAAQSAQTVSRRVAAQVGSLLDSVQQAVEEAVRVGEPSESEAPLGEAAAAVDAEGGPT